MAQRRWRDLSRRQRRMVLVAAVAQVSLALAAWTDLARRPAREVNGSKARWAVLIGVNFIGPIGYFLRGRKHRDHGVRKLA